MRDLFGNPQDESHCTSLSFRDWQIREGNVLYRSGVEQISNTHLLAHLLRSYQVSERLMTHFGSLAAISSASVVELKQVKGIGIATAETVMVAFELSRREMQVAIHNKPRIYGPQEIYLLLRDEFLRLKQEVLKVLLLDTKNRVEHIQTVFIGTLNASIIHPREVFKVAIRQSAASIVLCHNHPSGDPEPSNEDIAASKQLAKAGEFIGIQLLDHVIIGFDGYVSMKDRGLL